MLLNLPHRQFVFALPKALRIFFRHDRRLFGHVSRLIYHIIQEFYHQAAGRPIRTGVVIAHQTFGDMLRWNPHFHAIVLEGGFDEQGTFVYIPLGHLQAMTELLRRRVVALLVDQTCTSSTLWTSLPSSEIACGNSTAHPTGAGATHSSLWFVLLADQGSLDPHALRSAAGAIRLDEPR